jgi:hypothetical protein
MTAEREGVTRALRKPPSRRMLLQGSRNRRELRVQAGAYPVHDSNDRQRNAGSDQTVFDRRCPRLVAKKLLNETLHFRLQYKVPPDCRRSRTSTANDLRLNESGTFNPCIKYDAITGQIERIDVRRDTQGCAQAVDKHVESRWKTRPERRNERPQRTWTSLGQPVQNSGSFRWEIAVCLLWSPWGDRWCLSLKLLRCPRS